jgi:hypothetical protein
MSAHSVFSPLHEYPNKQLRLIPKRLRERETDSSPKTTQQRQKGGPLKEDKRKTMSRRTQRQWRRAQSAFSREAVVSKRHLLVLDANQ